LVASGQRRVGIGATVGKRAPRGLMWVKRAGAAGGAGKDVIDGNQGTS
jgi:hypothetical protein